MARAPDRSKENKVDVLVNLSLTREVPLVPIKK